MKFKINIPTVVNELIHILQRHGHSAYVVGGCVRDSILIREPNDWDVCTSATPNEMLEIFKDKKIVETGLQHGTVTIIIENLPIEVTTFRIDGEYSDNRRPDSVTFTDKLIEDLKRRDFTINAMAYNDTEGLIDPFNGLEDLKNKLIRCVGNPEDRFEEDALRILRAIRFACQLDFSIHPSVGWQIGYTDMISNLRNISVERINSEFVKIVKTKQFFKRLVWNYNVFLLFIPELKDMIGFQHNNPWHIYDVFCHTSKAIEKCESDDLIVRLSILFHDFGKPHSYQDGENNIRRFTGHWKVSADMTNNIMKRLRFDNDTRNKVVELVFYHDLFVEDRKDIKKLLNIIGIEQFERLLEIKRADAKAHNPICAKERIENINNIEQIFKEIVRNNECFSLKDLAVDGKDLIDLGCYKSGKELGEILDKLLQMVINGVNNNKEVLLEIAKCMYIEKNKYVSV